MKQTHVWAAMLLIVLVTVVAWMPRAAEADSDWNVYTDYAYGFSLRYPAQWTSAIGNQHAPGLPEDTLTFSSHRGVIDLTVITIENDSDLSLAEIPQRVFFGHFGPLDMVRSESRTIHGIPAMRIVYAQPEIEGEVVQYEATFLQTDRSVYWLFTHIATQPLTGQPTSAEHAIRIRLYDEIVSSFTPLLSEPGKHSIQISGVPIPTPKTKSSVDSVAVSSTFVWPSTGYLGYYLYGRPVSYGTHNGVDVWTKTDCTGNSGSQGNPIYAAASGTVLNFYHDGDGIWSIVGVQHADLGLWTWYWHMADQYNLVSFIASGLQPGQAVSSQTFLGNQGNRLWVEGGSVCVHLHFGVSSTDSYYNMYGIDPSPYFGLALNWNDPNHLAPMTYIERPSSCCVCSALAASKTSMTSTTATCSAFSSVAAYNREAFHSLAVAPQPSIATTSLSVPTVLSIPPAKIAPVAATHPNEAPIALPPVEARALGVARAPVEPLRKPPVSANYAIPKSVFGSGGGPKTSVSYRLQGTSGQTSGTGALAGASYQLHAGYWAGRPTPPTPNTPTATPTVTKTPTATARATNTRTATPIVTITPQLRIYLPLIVRR